MKIFQFVPVLALCLFLSNQSLKAQSIQPGFWDKVQYGGGLGLSFGNNYFFFNVAPSAIYNFNEYFALGPGLSYSYIKNGDFKTSITGGSVIALFNPLSQIQLSAELEELYVSQKQELDGGNRNRDFWNTALFLGAGYRSGPMTFGVRYNVLFDDTNSIYTSAIQPFVRVYF
ncbi:MAG: hypothetical protein COA80_05280 [Leeuwenhoekiella sp.]|nr:MAG: hypothetical protein COA80_05280 [Leeuwenhoekiella sp.]